MGGMSGEREPPGADKADTKGERHSGGAEKKAVAESGEREPKGAKASDRSGEKSVSLTNGIGMGKADRCDRDGIGQHDGRTGEVNTGNSGEGPHYKHKRVHGAKYA